MSTTPPVSRAPRSVVVLPVLMAIALLATVGASYQSVRAVVELAIRGQGDAFVHEVARRLREIGSVPSAADLEPVLSEGADNGLRCIAVFDHDDELLATVGDCVQPERAIDLPGGRIFTDGTRSRLLAFRRPGGRPPPPDGDPPAVTPDTDPLRPPRRDDPADSRRPPPRPRDRPFADQDRPLGDRTRRPPPRRGPPGREPAPPILVEFEPLAAHALQARARWTLGIGGGAAALLVIAGVLLWRQQTRAATIAAQAERDRRLTSLGEMSAVLAHEIRNPLQSMKGHAQLLEEQLTPGSREHDKAHRVVTEAVRLERLTDDLLSFVRTQKIEPVPIDPTALLREVASELDSARIRIGSDGAPATWPLDPARLRQVFLNLLRNAIEACPGTDPIDVAVTAAVTAADGALLVTVRDRGVGIVPGDESRLFEPFHTTRVRGTGLGLAVAQRIVELHGGSITARNHPDGGAEFRVVIPRTAPTPHQPEA